MIRRAIPAVAVVTAGVAAIVAVGRDEPVSPPPVFATPAGVWMPAVDDSDALTRSWFCPGVPATVPVHPAPRALDRSPSPVPPPIPLA